jgi:hypothetical protein
MMIASATARPIMLNLLSMLLIVFATLILTTLTTGPAEAGHYRRVRYRVPVVSGFSRTTPVRQRLAYAIAWRLPLRDLS